jgi:hypothetical protein
MLKQGAAAWRTAFQYSPSGEVRMLGIFGLVLLSRVLYMKWGLGSGSPEPAIYIVRFSYRARHEKLRCKIAAHAHEPQGSLLTTWVPPHHLLYCILLAGQS